MSDIYLSIVFYQENGIVYNFYADDSQLYLAFDPEDDAEATNSFEACKNEIYQLQWMMRNILKLHDSKAEFVNMGKSNRSFDAIKIGDENILAFAFAV